MPRFADLPPAKWTTEQRAVAEDIVAGPRGAVGGPFPTWLRKPELASRLQKLGEYIRFQRALPVNYVSIAILMTARHWRCQYEWDYHTKTALKAGISQRTIDCILANETPDDLSDPERTVYDFCRALHRDRGVTDEQFAAARDALGEEGVVELIAISGYYTMMAMALNVSEVPPTSGVRTDFPDA
jgi:4-carboxymuconolactone decarboxylase